MFCCFSLAIGSCCAAVPFTLDQALSAPFPSDLAGSGHGRIAWLQTIRGVRNIWVAEAPAYQARQLTAGHEDDGIELSEIRVSDDGQFVVYTRGGGPNGQNENPNPRHLLAGVSQTVEVIPFAGGAAKTVGRGHGPEIAPDGHAIAFVEAGQIYLAAVQGGNAAAVALTHNRGKAGDLNWSPDSQSLAFVSHRALHAQIAVYRAGDPSLTFLDPSSDYDGNPVWSPDSKRVAFTRIPSTLDADMHEPRRTADTPWSIRVADTVTGKGHEVWTALAGPGSVFHELESPRQIFWAAGDRIVFPWERTGWQHLYAVSVAGGSAVDLWPAQADGEIDQAALSPDRLELLWSSNAGDMEKRHVYRASVSGAMRPAPVGFNSIEWGPVFASPSAVAMLRSDPHQPARAAIVRRGAAADAIQDLAPETVRNDFPNTRLIAVNFPAADGLKIHGQLFLPPDGGPARHPAVVFLHGGSRRQMLLGWHPMLYYNQAYGFNKYLASKGYIVLSVNYRSGTGYGLNFREALNYGPSGGSEWNDVLGAGRYLRSRQDVLPEKIGLWGGSYGGYLTALGLARASDLFAAGVDLHGVHDWNDEMVDTIPEDQPEARRILAETALRSSPLADIKTWKSPVLLIQGDDDRSVDFRQTEIIVEALRKQHVPFEEIVFPDEGHDFLRHDHWEEAYRAAEAFLDKYLTR